MRSPLAISSVRPYIFLAELGGAFWTIFLGAVRSLWELSLPLPVGVGTRRPPTYVGARDHRPTAVSAPR